MRRAWQQGGKTTETAHSCARICIVCTLANSVIFTADLLVSPGVALEVAYGACVLLSMRSAARGPTLTAAVVASAFTVLGVIVGVSHGVAWTAMANGMLGLGVIWNLAAFCLWQKQGWRERESLFDMAQRAQHRQSQAEQAALEAQQARGDFVVSLTGELRRPAESIRGFADWLADQLPRGEELQAAEAIGRNAAAMTAVINDVYDLARIEGGSLDVHVQPCSPARIVRDVAFAFGEQADAKGLPLAVEYDGPLPETIQTDWDRLTRVLSNLVSNAVKFTEFGGVRIVTRLRGADEQTAAQLQIDVIDSGIGMTREQVSRLFRPFALCDRLTNRKFGGVGLGLTLSRRLADLLGGDLTVVTAPGEGSTFTLTVGVGNLEGVRLLDRPSGVLGADELRVDAAATAPALDCHVLLAECDPEQQRLVSFALRKAGAEVMLARNGHEAVDLALAAWLGRGRRASDPQRPFDVILMDDNLPILEGNNAVRLLRERGYEGPIVAMLSQSSAEHRENALSAGCDACLSKPFTRKQAVRAITRLVGSAATNVEK